MESLPDGSSCSGDYRQRGRRAAVPITCDLQRFPNAVQRFRSLRAAHNGSTLFVSEKIGFYRLLGAQAGRNSDLIVRFTVSWREMTLATIFKYRKENYVTYCQKPKEILKHKNTEFPKDVTNDPDSVW